MLDNDLSSSFIGNHSPRTHKYKSQHETILADLNRYMAKTLHLLIILTDDAFNYT